jgi:hypothetical protein
MVTTSRSAKFTNLRVKNLQWVSYDADDDLLDCSPYDERFMLASDSSVWEPDLLEELKADSAFTLNDPDSTSEPSKQVQESSPDRQNTPNNTINKVPLTQRPSQTNYPETGGPEAPASAPQPKRRGRPKGSVSKGKGTTSQPVNVCGATPAATFLAELPFVEHPQISSQISYDTNRVTKGSHNPGVCATVSYSFNPDGSTLQSPSPAYKRVRKDCQVIRTDDPESLCNLNKLGNMNIARIRSELVSEQDQDAWVGHNPTCAVCDCIPHTHEVRGSLYSCVEAGSSDSQIYAVHDLDSNTPFEGDVVRSTQPDSIRKNCMLMDGRVDRWAIEDDLRQHLERLAAGDSSNSTSTYSVNHVDSTSTELRVPDEETPISIDVQLSIGAALKSKDRDNWIEAISKEKLKLEAASTWRNLTVEESRGAISAVPLAVLLTQKRNGTFKARAVVLGDRIDQQGLELFAPTLSMPAHRMMLVEAAYERNYIIAFDINNAFLHADLEKDEIVNILLPVEWRKANERPVKRLLKALYGLPQAPMRWFYHYAKVLTGLGWQVCEHDKAMWRKPSCVHKNSFMKLSVYVDDNLICGPDFKELNHETAEILKHVSGRIEPHKVEGGFHVWDCLGAKLQYKRSSGEMRLTMPEYITKMVANPKFSDVLKMKPVDNPGISSEETLIEQKNELPGFPYRELIGSLQWTSTICRPDVTRAVNLLSRFVSKVPTKARVNFALRILKYLSGTKDLGVEFSQERDSALRTVYSKDGHGQPVQVGVHNLFVDASFAATVDNYYSVSGIILYYRGSPIAWKSGRQTIRTHSTCEAEWVAAAEGLKWLDRMGFLEFFSTKYSNSRPIPADLTLWTDSQSVEACVLAAENKKNSRHFILREFRVMEFAKNNKSRLRFCRTDYQRADGLTKCADKKQTEMLLGLSHFNPTKTSA